MSVDRRDGGSFAIFVNIFRKSCQKYIGPVSRKSVCLKNRPKGGRFIPASSGWLNIAPSIIKKITYKEWFRVMMHFVIIFLVKISMASSGQRSTDDQLQMKPVVRLRRQDLTRWLHINC
jgi:hypothetical protein